MKTKLTLTVDREAVARIKRLARRRGTSVSALFEQWTAGLARREGLPPLGERLRGKWAAGAARAPDARLDYLLEKHGGR